MGYQELKKPKFYIDMMSYLHAVGKTEYFKNEELYNTDLSSYTYSGTFEDLLYLNPISIIKTFNAGTVDPIIQFKSDKNFPTIPVDFIGLLNHNLSNQMTWVQSDISVLGASPYQFDKNINFGDSQLTIEHNGFSLATFTQTHLLNPEIIKIVTMKSAAVDSINYIGSFLMGCTWSPPHNPQLKASILRKFDGIKSKKTQAGHTRSDINYIGSGLWSGRNPFEQWNYETGFVPDDSNMIIEDNKANLGNRGRRSWKLTWDHVSETNVFAELEHANNTLDIVDSSINNPFLESNTFISRVWTPTLGGSLPFLFQIDDSNNNPDQFVIARFKRRSLTLTSKAPNLYSFSVDIEETH